jgi:hypothetical protein
MNLHTLLIQPVPAKSTGWKKLAWTWCFHLNMLDHILSHDTTCPNIMHILKLNHPEWICIILPWYSFSQPNPLAGNESTGINLIIPLTLAWSLIISWYNFSQHNPHPGTSDGIRWSAFYGATTKCLSYSRITGNASYNASDAQRYPLISSSILRWGTQLCVACPLQYMVQ